MDGDQQIDWIAIREIVLNILDDDKNSVTVTKLQFNFTVLNESL